MKALPSQAGVGNWSRTAPKVEVNIVWDGVVAQRADRLASLVAQASSKIDIADTTVVDKRHRLLNRLI